MNPADLLIDSLKAKLNDVEFVLMLLRGGRDGEDRSYPCACPYSQTLLENERRKLEQEIEYLAALLGLDIHGPA